MIRYTLKEKKISTYFIITEIIINHIICLVMLETLLSRCNVHHILCPLRTTSLHYFVHLLFNSLYLKKKNLINDTYITGILIGCHGHVQPCVLFTKKKENGGERLSLMTRIPSRSV